MGSASHTQEAGVIMAALMPHPPVVIPGVGGRRGKEASATMQAMATAARRIVAAKPDAVTLISPHSPRKPASFGIWSGDKLFGSLERFGDPADHVDLPNDTGLASLVATSARSRSLYTWPIHGGDLDHGATVPLWYLADAGWKGPTVILSLNYPGEGDLEPLGEAVAEASRNAGKRVAFIASGDMSHRLKEGSPSGFHPQARDFDARFIDLLRAKQYREITHIDPDLQELAAEDVVDSTVVAAAATDWQTQGSEVLSYEGPFGVGYGVAVLYDGTARQSAEVGEAGMGGEDLPKLARESIRASLHGLILKAPAPRNDYEAQKCGVFVTIRNRAGKLRGCLGTLTPKFHNVAEEVWNMARDAAFRDHRFAPVTSSDFPALVFEVSVLSNLEDVTSPEDLDPAQYGVIVQAADGRRGTLLPGIPDITTVEEQLDIARRKARIEPWEPVRLQRYRVDKFKDPQFVESDD